MKFRKHNKKGFTIVELVIVIAVVGVLAAILIPTFVTLTKKAQVATMQSFVVNINKQLAIKEATEGKNDSMYDAIEDGKEIGFDVEKITPFDNHDIVWDSVNDRFVLLKDDSIVLRDETKTLPNKEGILDKTKLYKVAKTEAEVNSSTYSVYLGVDVDNNDHELTLTGKGIDFGNNKNIKKVNYVGSEGSEEVILRSNSASIEITINDTYNAKIMHYGDLGQLLVTETGYDCYYEYGTTTFAKAVKGKVVAKEGGSIEALYATVAAVAAVEDGGTIGNAYCVSTSAAEAEDTGYTNFSNSKDGNVTFTYVDEDGNPLTSEVIEETGEALVTEAETQEEVKEQYADKVFWEDCIEDISFDGGIGTEENPYRISTPMQLALLSHNVNNNVSAEGGYTAYDVAYYALKANINLSGKAWTPIGNSKDIQFGGKIDGNKHIISGLTNGAYRGEITENHFTGHIGETYGFVGFTKGEVELKNITMKDVNISYDNAKICAALVGDTGSNKTGSGTDALTKKLHITNCHVEGNIRGYDKVAGLVGYLINVPDVKVENCTVAGNLSLTNYGSTKGYRAGGLFGYCSLSRNNNDTYSDWIVKDVEVSATLSKGDSASTKFWIGAIASASNANIDIAISNFMFTGEIKGHNLVGSVSDKKDNNLGSVYTQYADLLDTNGNVLFGNVGNAGEIWWTRVAGGVRSISPTEVVNALVGENRDYLYHLSSPEANEDGSYSFKFKGEGAATNFDNPAANINIGGRASVNCSTGAITDNTNVLTSGHTVISSEYTYYDLLKEVLQNHFVLAND